MKCLAHRKHPVNVHHENNSVHSLAVKITSELSSTNKWLGNDGTSQYQLRNSQVYMLCSLTHKLKLGHSELAESLNHHQSSNQGCIHYPKQRHHRRDSRWGHSSQRSSGSSLPSPRLLVHYRLRRYLWLPTSGSIPGSAQANAGWLRWCVAGWRRGGSPTPAPCAVSPFLQSWSLRPLLKISIGFSFWSLYSSTSITSTSRKPKHQSFSPMRPLSFSKGQEREIRRITSAREHH